MKRIILVVFSLAILSGCANTLVMKDGPMNGEKQFNLLVAPVQSMGVEVTKNIMDGNVTVIEAPIPDKGIAAEIYPGRIRWNGLAAGEDGKEFLVQFVLDQMYKSGEYKFSVIIEGDKKALKDSKAKVVFLSSKGEFVCNFEGGFSQIDSARFRNEKAYRLEIVKQFGSRVGSRHQVNGYDKIVRSWNRYTTYQGEILTPYGDEDFKRIARINPGYNLMDKIVLNGKVTLSTNPIYTLWTIGFSIIEGMTAKSEGWDYMSQIPDRIMMGQIVEFVGKLRLEVIRQLNEQNAFLEAEALKKAQVEKEARVVPAQQMVVKPEVVAEKKNSKKIKKGERR